MYLLVPQLGLVPNCSSFSEIQRFRGYPDNTMMNLYFMKLLWLVCLLSSYAADGPLKQMLGDKLTKNVGFWWDVQPSSFVTYDESCPVFISKYSCPWNKRSVVSIDQSLISAFLNKTSHSHIFNRGFVVEAAFHYLLCILEQYVGRLQHYIV